MKKSIVILISLISISCSKVAKDFPTNTNINEVNNYVINYELPYINCSKPFKVIDTTFFSGNDLILKQTVFYLDTFFTNKDKDYMNNQIDFYLKECNKNTKLTIDTVQNKIPTLFYLSKPIFSIDKNTCLVFLSIDLKKNKILILRKTNKSWKNIAMKDIDFSKHWMFRVE